MTRKPSKKVDSKSPSDSQLDIHDRASDWAVLIIALMIFMAPAMGVPSEEMLQDTLKSIIVSLGTLSAVLAYFLLGRRREIHLPLHSIVCLPLGLSAYALGSMVWSHTYLAGVEAIRWFVFSLLLWIGCTSFNTERLPRLLLGIHLGVTAASVWTALQFWFDLKYFPQGADPASTFVNRNFFAEYAVCALPLSFFLLVQESRPKWIGLFTVLTAFDITAILMTGTRSALVGTLWVIGISLVILFQVRKVYQRFNLGFEHPFSGSDCITFCFSGTRINSNPK